VDNLTKSSVRRGFDRRFATRWFVGDGIDIGFANHQIARFIAFFPLIRSLCSWDNTGDLTTYLTEIANESYDFVHSDRALKSVLDPYTALQNWIRICKRGGYLIITLDDEDLRQDTRLYTLHNAEVNWTFTIAKVRSVSPKSVNVMDMLTRFIPEIEIIKIELLDSDYVYPEYLYHATNENSESAIEVVLRRRLNLEPEPTIFVEPPIPELIATSEGYNPETTSAQNADRPSFRTNPSGHRPRFGWREEGGEETEEASRADFQTLWQAR
jgi:SAM-dependent methyltransferase